MTEKNNQCDTCRAAEATCFAGPIKVCKKCGGIEAVLTESGVLDPSCQQDIPIPRDGRNYRVRPDILLVAELRAAEACRRTGKPVSWTDVIRYVLARNLLPPTASSGL